MTRRDWAGAAVITSYWLATVWMHLDVALWLVRRRESELLGSWRLADFLPHAAVLLTMAVVIWQLRRAVHDGRYRVATLMCWAGWIAMIVAIDRLLLFSFPEYLHYPQYALLAWLLAWFVDRQRSGHAIAPILLAVTLLGIADEALQYAWITVSYSNYLDFNDFLLNLTGGMAGLLLYYGFPGKGFPSKNFPSKGFSDKQFPREPMHAPAPFAARSAIAGWLALGVGMLLALALLHAVGDGTTLPWIERTPSYGEWIVSQRSGYYFVLPPAVGTLLLIVPGLVVSLIFSPRAGERKARTRQTRA